MTQKVSCEELQSLLPAYSIGALDRDEQLQVEQMLDECPELSEEAADYRTLSEAMLMTAPPVKAPSRILDNILKSAQTSEQKKQYVGWRFFQWRWGYAVIGILVILLLGTNFYWANRVQELDQDLNTLDERVAVLDQTNATVTTQLQDETQSQEQIPVAIAMNSGMPSQVMNYSSTQYTNQLITQQNSSQATLTWRPGIRMNTWIGVLEVQNLPAQSEDSAYQLWLYKENQTPLNVGLFDVDDQGNGIFIFDIVEPIETFDEFGITNEPATGNILPSGDTIIQSPIENWQTIP